MIDWSKIDPDENLRLTELHFAAQDGDINAVKQLLNEGHDPNLFDEISHTPLHNALENGHLEVCDVLL
ncbi:MAG: ankyrin repeat domain-containing protein, partial [Candidatus Hydrogenedentes bacterium]|nr:ankyrin repeat domain-containing protein [Candidatus Hydrogenedentota bacterium]